MGNQQCKKCGYGPNSYQLIDGYCIPCIKAKLTSLQAENKRLREDLIEYGRHAAGCSQEFALKYRCRCGWDKVEKALNES